MAPRQTKKKAEKVPQEEDKTTDVVAHQKVQAKQEHKDIVLASKAGNIKAELKIKCPKCGSFLASMDNIPLNMHMRCGECKSLLNVIKPKRPRV